MNNNLLIDHTKLIKGQKLWDARYGEVIYIGKSMDNKYPILCKSNNSEKTYTFDGFNMRSDSYPLLYLSNPFEQINEFPKLMEVSYDNKKWHQKKVLYIKRDGYTYALDDVGSVIIWTYSREIQEPTIIEYTLEEIANKLGLDSNTKLIIKK